jgi:predicted DNA-binding transcriptional regulator AlpA
MSVSVTQPELLTPKQVAEKLQVDVQLLNQWRSARKGPKFHKLGRFIRYKADELQEWIDSQVVETDLKLV